MKRPWRPSRRCDSLARVDARHGLGYLPSLDGIRAIGVLIVLASHAGLSYVRGGGIGVDLFFALSGFLITSLLLIEQRENGFIDLPRFYGRRALRLFPALVLLLLSVVVLGLLLPNDQDAKDALAGVLPVALYVGNWVRAFGGDLGYLGHTWSLAVEEQFYVVWPLLLLAITAVATRRRAEPARAVLAAALVGCAIALALRVALWQDGTIARIYNGTDTRADFLLYGCALAAVLQLVGQSGHQRLTRAAAALFPLAALGLAGLVVLEPQRQSGLISHLYVTLGYTVVAVACTVVVAHAVLGQQTRTAQVLSTSVLRFLGRISYGIYLWQLPVMHLLHEAGLNGLPLLLAGAAVTVAVAAASYYAVERPLQHRYRARLVALRRSEADVPSAPAYVDPQP